MKKYLVKKLYDENNYIDEFGIGRIERTFSHYEIVCATDSMSLPRGNDHIFIKGVLTKYPAIQIDQDGNMSIVESVEAKELSDAHEQMDEGILEDAANVYKSRETTALLASVSDTLLHIIAPELFISDEEFATISTASFGVGEPLDTFNKIEDYYKELAHELQAKRKAKIKIYKDKKEELGL